MVDNSLTSSLARAPFLIEDVENKAKGHPHAISNCGDGLI